MQEITLTLTMIAYILAAFLIGLFLGGAIVYKLTHEHKANPFKTNEGKRYEQGIKLALTTENKKTGWFVNLSPSELRRLRVLARGLVDGKDLSGSLWMGKGKLFSRAEYEMMIGLFLKYSWVYWNNPKAHNKGMTITPEGLSVFRFLAANSPSPINPGVRTINPDTVAYTHIKAYRANNG